MSDAQPTQVLLPDRASVRLVQIAVVWDPIAGQQIITGLDQAGHLWKQEPVDEGKDVYWRPVPGPGEELSPGAGTRRSDYRVPSPTVTAPPVSVEIEAAKTIPNPRRFSDTRPDAGSSPAPTVLIDQSYSQALTRPVDDGASPHVTYQDGTCHSTCWCGAEAAAWLRP